MNRKGELICAWSGPLAIILFGIGWVGFANWLMPPPPGLGAAEIAAAYQSNTIGIRTGMMLIMYGGALNAAFAALIMVYMLRMKGPSPALAYTQFGSGIVNVLFFIIPAQVFGAVAFRPDRAADITLFGNDLGWFLFDMVTPPTMVQVTALGLAILWDKSQHPVFPRWFAFFNFWCALLLVPATLITYFKNGPFDWAGILGFYVGLVAFCAWYLIMFILLLKAIKQRALDES